MTVPAPTFDALPSRDELAAIDCPVELAKRICAASRHIGTLPRWLAEMRRDALIRALDLGWSSRKLGREVGVAGARIRIITGPIAETT